MDALTALPGVGRKTANVVLGHALGVPGLPVDRHVLRVANRIGIAQAETPEEVETQLTDAMPRDKWTLTSDTLILHGRRVCRPRPLCEECRVVEHCEYARAWHKADAMTTTSARAAASAKASAKTKPAASKSASPARGTVSKRPKLAIAAAAGTSSANGTKPAPTPAHRLVAKVTSKAGGAGATKPGRRVSR
jgi:adenine-specific DNA glycosylase